MGHNNKNVNRTARVIAVLLLAAIGWASTAEFTHRHGGRSASTASLSTQTQTDTGADQTANPAVQTSPPSRSSSRTNTASECLICQLHHNLATTLLSEPASIAALQPLAAHEALPARVHLLDFTAAQSGRAPPLSFLS